LSALLRKYDEKLMNESENSKSREKEEREFRALAETMCNQIIRPAMEEVGAILEKSDHKYEINDAKSLASLRIPHMSNLVVGMTIFPKRVKRPDVEKVSYQAQVLVGIDADEKEVQFGYWKLKRLGEGGYGGHYKANALTRELVEQEILRALSRILT
jgi:hypothetical protein